MMKKHTETIASRLKRNELLKKWEGEAGLYLDGKLEKKKKIKKKHKPTREGRPNKKILATRKIYCKESTY